jgi:hypothetical protein
MIMSDIQMAKHSQTAGNFAMAPMTYNKYCPVLPESQPPSNVPLGGCNNGSGDKCHSSYSDEGNCRDSPASFKKAKIDEQVEFSKLKGMFKLVAGKGINDRLNKLHIIKYDGKCVPFCSKHCLAGLACQFKSCRFHYLSLAVVQSLKPGNKASLKAYKKTEPAITWCGDGGHLNLTSSNQNATETVPNTASSGYISRWLHIQPCSIK